MSYKAEYIWVDGQKPTAKLRSKGKVVSDGETPPIWGFDGSSTNQAPGENSDCVLNPVFVCPDPMRGEDNKLVMCEVLLTDMTPHDSNTRAACAALSKKYSDLDMWFGIEQEYTYFDGIKPLGWPDNGFPAPQGGYYCGVGFDEVFGRPIVEDHLNACLHAGLSIAGINGEVMPGQWEFQIGPIAAPAIADQLWVARWLLYRIGEQHKVSATLDPKPVRGDWNGAGAHTNFATVQMRNDYDACVAAAEALGTKADLHIANYGDRIEERLTVSTRPVPTGSSGTACPTGVLRSGFLGRWHGTGKDTSKTAGPTPMPTRTWLRDSYWIRSVARLREVSRYRPLGQ